MIRVAKVRVLMEAGDGAWRVVGLDAEVPGQGGPHHAVFLWEGVTGEEWDRARWLPLREM